MYHFSYDGAIKQTGYSENVVGSSDGEPGFAGVGAAAETSLTDET